MALRLAGALLLSGSGAAFAQDLHPGIIGRDDRKRFVEGGPPWDAVGQVNIGGYRVYGWCTGTLIAPDKVLTAAHCVMDHRTRKPALLDTLHFLAAVNGPENKGHGEARCLVFLPGYEFRMPEILHPTLPVETVAMEFFEKDVAIIVLKQKLAVAPVEIVSSLTAEPGLSLTHASYPGDRRYALTVHFDCQLLRAETDKPMWFNDCDMHSGSSGGPLFVREGGQLKVAAVMLGGSGRLFNIALPYTVWGEMARKAECPDERAPAHVAPPRP